MKAGKQFQQMELVPREEAGLQGSPASQSPEEFRDDPQTVFHASYRQFPKVQGSNFPSGFTGIHAGTQQAALERASNQGSYYPDTTGPMDLAVGPHNTPKHVVHPLSLKGSPLPTGDTRGSVHNPMSDDEANSAAIIGGRGDKPVAYRNSAEDKGSLSVSWENRPSHIQQSDWVRDAVNKNYEENRRGDYGIHPRTMAMHNMRSLDTYDQRDHKDIAASLYTSSKGADGGLFPYYRDPGGGNPNVPVSREEFGEHYKSMEAQAKAQRPEGLDPLRTMSGMPGQEFSDHPSFPYNDRESADASWARSDMVGRLSDFHQEVHGTYTNVGTFYDSTEKERPGGDIGDLSRGHEGVKSHGKDTDYRWTPKSKYVPAKMGAQAWPEEGDHAAVYTPSVSYSDVKIPAKKAAAKKLVSKAPAKKVAAKMAYKPSTAPYTSGIHDD